MAMDCCSGCRGRSRRVLDWSEAKITKPVVLDRVSCDHPYFHFLRPMNASLLLAALVFGSTLLTWGEGKRLGSLSEEDAKALKNHKMLMVMNWAAGGFYRIGYFHRIDLAALADDITYPKGKMSLVIDPKDQYHDSIAVYLINASDQPLKNAIDWRTRVFQEVRQGKNWLRCEVINTDRMCGMDTDPLDLDPGCMMLLEGLYPDPPLGDLEGEIRYVLHVEGFPPIATSPMKGRFSSKGFAAAGRDDLSYGGLAGDFTNGLIHGEWSLCRYLHAPEQIVAGMELDRCYDESRSGRACIERWLKEPGPRNGDEQCREALQQLLGKPWDRVRDERNAFRRCLTALLSDRHATHPYGSPEKCRAVAWNYLLFMAAVKGNEWMNPERWAQVEELRASGNPWGAGKEELKQLVILAEQALREGDDFEKRAAGAFLASKSLPQEFVSESRFRELLADAALESRRAGLMGLMARGKDADADAWLSAHRQELGEQQSELWVLVTDYRPGPLAEWEIPFALEALKREPLMMSSRLESRYRSSSKTAVPVVFRQPVRDYLLKESVEWKIRGTEKLGGDQATQNAYYLASAVSLLGQWKNAEDTELLRKFLSHPAVHRSVSDKTFEFRSYGVRRQAKYELEKRGEVIPEGVILEEQVPIGSPR